MASGFFVNEFSTLEAAWRAFISLGVQYDWKNDSDDTYGIIAAAKSFSDKDPATSSPHFSQVTIATAIEIVIEAFCTPSPSLPDPTPILQNRYLAAHYHLRNNKSDIPYVLDITARDALGANTTKNTFVVVIDASADPTVNTGGAMYFRDVSSNTWTKVAEYKSTGNAITEQTKLEI